MGRHLLLTVRFHGDASGTARYHGMTRGESEWPPAPGRLFQALVAAAARGSELPEDAAEALAWLETLPAPMVGAPRAKLGTAAALFVPNNDADAVPDPRDVSGIRTKKIVRPCLFSAAEPLLYAWELPSDSEVAAVVVEVANDLYQLGRGVDVAWASGEVLDSEVLEQRLQSYGGVLHRPNPGTQGDPMLPCPTRGSLASLLRRHRTPKLQIEGVGKKARVLFTNPPKALFESVSFEPSVRRVVYSLQDRDAAKPWAWRLHRVTKLVEKIRDTAAARLRDGLGGSDDVIERCLIGRKADGRHAGPTVERIRIVPLPSIGSHHADRAVRRVLVEIPSRAPLRSAEVEWAFSGLEWMDPETGELSPLVLTRADGDDMLDRYVEPSRRWRSVTAVALPERARRRRIEPTRRREEAKPGAERSEEERQAVLAVHQALRHEGVRATAVKVRVQREPFDPRGARAELFAEDTRFAKEQLWHVELELDRQVSGPMVLGDGRFLGLGVMVPVAEAARAASTVGPGVELDVSASLFAFEANGVEHESPEKLARALRRAVMARAQAKISDRAQLDRFFSGHEKDGSKAKAATEHSNHLAFQWEPVSRRLLVIPPHALDRRPPTFNERKHVETLCAALEGLVELRAGRAGRLHLVPTGVEADDELVKPSRRWISVSPYTVTRHTKHLSAHEAIERDVVAECLRRGFPKPRVTIVEARGVSGRGLEARIQLEFSVAVQGPVVLGRTRHLGGGLLRSE